MSSLDACIYTIIAVLGVAYPILLQVISRLDDKYSSARAVELFDQELVKTLFIGSLITASGAVVIWFGKFAPPPALIGAPEWLCGFVNHSALLLVYGSTLGLLAFFFWLTHTILTYYNTQKFVAYLQRRHQQNRADELSIGILTDVFLAVLSARNSSVLERMRAFFSAEFQREREVAGQRDVVYPPTYYELAYRSAQELGRLGSRQDRQLAGDATGGGWLLGGIQPHRLSEITYSAIWRNLLVALEYGQDDSLYTYWQNACRHFEYALPIVEEEGEQQGEHWQTTNSAAVTARKEERERFLEFHHALGAVLLYTGKAALVRRMWRYTTSEPPHYWLLPTHSTEIFAAFARYQDAFGGRTPADILYPFPNEAGVGSEGLITRWRCFYLAVLFLRQYTLPVRYTYDQPLGLPAPPAAQPAKQQWLGALPFFRRLLTQALDDAQLLRELGLDFLTKTWCHEQHLPYPVQFIDQVEQHLQAAFRQDAAALPLDQDKVEKFLRESGQLLERAADEISHLGTAVEASDFEVPSYLYGNCQLVDKDNYASQPVSTNLTFSTSLANQLRLNLRDELARLFLQKTTKQYRLAPAEVGAALDKLALDAGWIILNLGINLNRIAFDHKLVGLSAHSYKGIEILTVKGNYVINSLLLIRRTELPKLRFIPLEPAETGTYALRRISDKVDLYGSVLNANEASSAVMAELQEGKFGSVPEAGVATLALETLALKLEFSWQKGAQPIKLHISDPVTGSALPSDLAAVIPVGTE